MGNVCMTRRLDPLPSTNPRPIYTVDTVPSIDVKLGEVISKSSRSDVLLGEWSGSQVICKKPSQRINFERELTLLANIRHPYIIQLLGKAKINNGDYIIVEYLKLADLSNHFKTLKVEDMINVMISVIKGLLYLQGMGVTHNNILPENILIGHDSNTSQYYGKVLDFSKSFQAGVTEPFAIEYPVRWSSPEVLESNSFSLSSDVWSFGVTMWQMFSKGEIPYNDLSDEEIKSKVIKDEVRLSKPQILNTNNNSNNNTHHNNIWKAIESCLIVEQKSKDDSGNVTTSTCYRASFQQVFEMVKKYH